MAFKSTKVELSKLSSAIRQYGGERKLTHSYDGGRKQLVLDLLSARAQGDPPARRAADGRPCARAQSPL